MLKLYSILFISAALITGAKAQQLKVIDYYSLEPIPNAHICTESENPKEQNFWVTNVDGTKENTLKYPSKVVVTFMGYQAYVDSLYPNKSATFKLKPSVEQLSEVVVTGQINPETKDKSIYNVQVINKLDIQNKAANTLGDLLATELNIKVENNGVLGSSISMQGLSGEHIKILIDGVPVLGRQNGNIDLSQINMQNVDHIEIVEGPMSVVYGSNALAGAINIITKKNTRPKFFTGLNTYYESVGIYNVDATFTKNWKNNYINLTGGRNFFNGYYPNNYHRNSNESDNNSVDATGVTSDFDPKEQYFGTLDYGYSYKKLKLNLTQDFFNEQIINYGTITTEDIQINDTQAVVYSFARDEYHNTIRANTKGDVLIRLNETTNLSFLGAFSYYNKAKNTYKVDLYTLESSIVPDSLANDTSVFNSYMSRGILTKNLNKFELQGGYDFNIETATGKRLDGTERIDDYAAFANAKYSILPNLNIQGGGRFIYNSKYDAPIVYSVNIKYDPLPKLNVRASYGTGFRSPSLKELYLDFNDSNHAISGNENLEAEYSKSINLAVNYNFDYDKHLFETSVKFYHTLLENKIDFIYDPVDPTKADYGNIDGTFKTIGTQADVTYRFHPRLKLNGGINYYGNSKLSDLDQYTFTTDYTLGLNYSNVKYGFKINMYYKRNGEERQFTNSGTESEPIIEERYIASYDMLDLSIARPFFDERLMVSTGIKNLLNVINVASSGSGGGAHSGGSNGSSTMGWGRTFFIKININLTKY